MDVQRNICEAVQIFSIRVGAFSIAHTKEEFGKKIIATAH